MGPPGVTKQRGRRGFRKDLSSRGFASALDSGAGLDVKTFSFVVIGICENNIKR
jgi:hypothetical protein